MNTTGPFRKGEDVLHAHGIFSGPNNALVVLDRVAYNPDRSWLLRHYPRVVDARRIVFLDQTPARWMLRYIRKWIKKGIEVHVRDHHKGDFLDSEEDVAWIHTLQNLLGERMVYVTRVEAPSCSQLVEPGEFSRSTDVIFADHDLDGVLAALKATEPLVRDFYTEIDHDGRLVDGDHGLRDPDALSFFGQIMVATTQVHHRDMRDDRYAILKYLLRTIGQNIRYGTPIPEKIQGHVATWRRVWKKSCRYAEEYGIRVANGRLVIFDPPPRKRLDIGALIAVAHRDPECAIVVVTKHGDLTTVTKEGVRLRELTLVVNRKWKGRIDLRKIIPALIPEYLTLHQVLIPMAMRARVVMHVWDDALAMRLMLWLEQNT